MRTTYRCLQLFGHYISTASVHKISHFILYSALLHYCSSVSGPEVLFQDLRRDEIRGWWWWWWC